MQRSMRSRTAGCLFLPLMFALACGDDSSTPAAPDAGLQQPGVDAGIAVDGGVDGGFDAMPPVCGELVTEVSGDISSVVVDDARIYWREVNADKGITYIKRVGKSGGDVEDVAFTIGFIDEFVVDGEQVFYSDYDGVWAIPAAGGDRLPLSDVEGFRGQIAVDASRVYWVNPLGPQGGRDVLARPKDGSAEAVEISIDFDKEGAIEDLAVDDAGLYFFDGVNAAAMRAPREGGLAEQLGTSGRSTIEELVVIGDHVYWRTQGSGIQGGPIYRAPRDEVSTEEAQLVADLSDFEGIKVHAGYLYAVDRRLGLKRFSLDSGDPSGELVEDAITIGSFAVDDDGIFFRSDDGQSSSIRVAPLTGCP
jgi:hypothetical protein